MAADLEIVDGLTGTPLDHQVDTLRTERFLHELTPAIHAAKQGALADPALFEPERQCRHRTILFAGHVSCS